MTHMSSTSENASLFVLADWAADKPVAADIVHKRSDHVLPFVNSNDDTTTLRWPSVYQLHVKPAVSLPVEGFGLGKDGGRLGGMEANERNKASVAALPGAGRLFVDEDSPFHR